MNSEKRTVPKNIGLATLIAYAIVPISGFATDIYLPSMPRMATELQTSQAGIQLTLSLFLISYGATQLIAGVFLDSFGRYKLSLIALFVFSLSSLITATTHSLAVIYAMRLVQGVCTAFTIVACRAFFVDVYEGEKKKNYLSLMTIVWSAGPIIAPFAGGYLEHVFGWKSNFYVLAIYSMILFFAQLIFSGETIKTRIKMNFQSVLKSYATILSAKDFVSGILILGIAYAMIMLFSLSGAFIVEHKMGFSPVVAGYVSLILGIAWMCGGFIGKVFLNKNFLIKSKTAFIIQTLLIVGMITSASFFNNIWTLVSFAFVIHVTCGFIFNNYFTYCLGRFPQFAGIAGGLTGGMAYTITAFLSYGIIAALKPESQLTVGVGYLIIGILGIVIVWLSRKVYLAD
jgi:MFS transporter, DHA1 family, multidrug resistance protein